MNTEDMAKLTRKISKVCDRENPAAIIGASLNMVQTVCNYEPTLRASTASFLRHFADTLDMQAAGVTEH